MKYSGIFFEAGLEDYKNGQPPKNDNEDYLLGWNHSQIEESRTMQQFASQWNIKL